MSRRVFDLRDVRKTRLAGEGFQLHLPVFQVRQGSALALVGHSGCGKSTALDLLSCALKPDQPAENSRFLFSPSADRTVDLYAAWKRGGRDALAGDRMRHLGYILQTGGLLPFLTARDNITLTCKALNIVHRRIQAIKAICERLGIEHLLSKYPAQLSVGERQRVAIAKALAHSPSVVLADEPTAALDPARSMLVMRLFIDLAREQGTTVIMVSHDEDLADEAGFSKARCVVREAHGSVISTLAYKDAEADSSDAASAEVAEREADAVSRGDREDA